MQNNKNFSFDFFIAEFDKTKTHWNSILQILENQQHMSQLDSFHLNGHTVGFRLNILTKLIHATSDWNIGKIHRNATSVQNFTSFKWNSVGKNLSWKACKCCNQTVLTVLTVNQWLFTGSKPMLN